MNILFLLISVTKFRTIECPKASMIHTLHLSSGGSANLAGTALGTLIPYKEG